MARMIKYRAQCFKCQEWVEPGHGYLHRDYKTRSWKAHCRLCHEGKKISNLDSATSEGQAQSNGGDNNG